MLIIFDLDDTLIDTSGCIIPLKLKMALQEMVAAGLPITDFQEAYDRLVAIDLRSQSSRHALKEFLSGMSDATRFFTLGEKIVYDTLAPDLPIYPFSGVVEILEELSKFHTLALVSQGKEPIQMDKMEKAGIDSTLFCKIIVSENLSKRNHYEMIVKALSADPSQTIVCGDKVEVDLLPAKELGMTTIHLRKGRGRLESSCAADYQIIEFAQIKDVIKEVQTR